MVTTVENKCSSGKVVSKNKPDQRHFQRNPMRCQPAKQGNETLNLSQRMRFRKRLFSIS